MKELICPNCGKPFQVDDADYTKLLGQVKNDEFQAELNTRIEELHAQWESEHQVAELREAQKHQDAIRQLDRTEALFDTLFVLTVSQEYYLRLRVDAYEELIPREITKCFESLNN